MPRAMSNQTAKRIPESARFAGRHPEEVISVLCSYFCAGIPVKDLRHKVNSMLGTRLNREDPWRILSQAAGAQRLRYVAPLEGSLQELIKDRYRFLDDVRVISTSTIDDVADHGAAMLLRLVSRLYADRAATKDRVVRVGFGGGRALRLLAKRFSELLSDPNEVLGLGTAAPARTIPAEIEFYAMIGGGFEGSITNPNAYFTYFLHQPASGVRLKVFGLPTPDVVGKGSEFNYLKRMRPIASVRSKSTELDIIVSSAGEWQGERHNKFRDVLLHYASLLDSRQRDAEGRKLRGPSDWVGDFLWFPIDAGGQQVDFPTSFRCMTLLDGIDDVRRLVQDRKTEVLLVIGPCDKCDRLKTNVLQAILSSPSRLLTRLVIDARTAGDLLNPRKPRDNEQDKVLPQH